MFYIDDVEFINNDGSVVGDVGVRSNRRRC